MTSLLLRTGNPATEMDWVVVVEHVGMGVELHCAIRSLNWLFTSKLPFPVVNVQGFELFAFWKDSLMEPPSRRGV